MSAASRAAINDAEIILASWRSALCRPCSRTSSPDDSWSSKCTPAAPASIIDFISSNTLSGPPKPASASATIGANHSRGSSGLAGGDGLSPLDLVGAAQRVVDPAHDGRDAVGGVQALVGAPAPRDSRRPPPASRRGRWLCRPAFHHLHRLATGHRAQRAHVGLIVDQDPTVSPRAPASRGCARCSLGAAQADRPGCASYPRSMPAQRGSVAHSCSRAAISMS